jgi:hypothetical protein
MLQINEAIGAFFKRCAVKMTALLLLNFLSETRVKLDEKGASKKRKRFFATRSLID